MGGEASRMPTFMELVAEVFELKIDNLSRTMNTSEAVANGCAVQAQILGTRSNTQKFQQYKLFDYNPYAISA